MSDKRLITEITIEDALELGRLEGIKEVLRELEDITTVNDIAFVRAYVKARLKSIINVTKGTLKSE